MPSPTARARAEAPAATTASGETMSFRPGIHGYGRIGRCILRALRERNCRSAHLRRLVIAAWVLVQVQTLSCGDVYFDILERKADPATILATRNEITSFSFPSLSAAGVISGTNIAVTVPFGTDVSSLVAAFTTTGESVTVTGALQTSGSTTNSFSGPVIYRVTSPTGSTRDYTVTVSIATSDAKDLTLFQFTSANNSVAGVTSDCTGIFTGTNIDVTVPYGTDLTGLVATYSTTGQSVTVAGVLQTSNTTANNFSGTVTYTVWAADGSSRTYTVNVTVALNSAKDITGFAFTSALNLGAGITSDCTATIAGTSITVKVPNLAVVTGLVATFATTGDSVAVSAVPQTSGTTVNDFSSPVTYTVTAADGSTKNFTVTLAYTSLAASSFSTGSGSGPVGVAVNTAANGGNGILYVTLSDTNAVVYYNAATGAYLYGTLAASRFATGTYPVGVAVNPTANGGNGILYVSNNVGNTMTYLDATTGANLGSLATGSGPGGVAFNPVADIVYVANMSSPTVTYLTAAAAGYLNGTFPASSFSTGTRSQRVAVNPSALSGSGILYVTDYDAGTVTYLNATTGAGLGSFSTGSSPVGVAYNSSANIVYVVNSDSNTVTYLNAATGADLGSYATGSRPWGVAVNTGANIVYTVNNWGNTVTYLNAATGAVLGNYTTGSSPGEVAVNPGLNILYVTNRSSNTVTFYDATTGAFLY
jgi:YVTN family beta-propeller protein